jgi:hypothetical protein
MKRRRETWNMLHFGLLRTAPIFESYGERKYRVGWKLWFQNGAHYVWLDATGLRCVWGPVGA